MWVIKEDPTQLRSLFMLTKADGQAVVAHACNPSSLGGRGREISEVSLSYRVSSRTGRAIQRNPVSGKKKPKKPRQMDSRVQGQPSTEQS